MDGQTIAAVGTVVSASLMGMAAVVAAYTRRERNNDERLMHEVASLRRYANRLRAALGEANRILIRKGLQPVDVPVEEEAA